MTLVGLAINAYKASPLYPHWGRRLAAILSTTSKLAGVPAMQKMKVPCGIMMNIDREQAIDTKLKHGQFEPASIRLIERLVQPGWHCCDVGANIGVLSLLMAKSTGAEGRVFCFEPSDWTFKRLQANIAINPYTWVEAHCAAVGSESKPEVELLVPCGYRLDGKQTATLQKMPLVALDDFFTDDKRLDFLKIDTDGYEPYVLAGARKTIARCRPVVFFELGPDHLKRAGSSAEELIQFFADLGYRFEDEDGKTIDPLVEASKLFANKTFNVVALAR